MIYMLAAGSFLLLAYLSSVKNRLPASSDSKFVPILIRNAYDFALPFTITVWAYATFSAVLFLRLNPRTASFGLLAQSEEFAGQLGQMASAIKVPKILFLCTLITLFVCSLISVRDATFGQLGRTAPQLARLARFMSLGRRYNKTLSGFVSGLTAATMFTFFGVVPGQPQSDLQAHLKHFNQAIGSVEEKLDRRIRQDLATEVVARVIDAMPNGYKDGLRRYLENSRRMRAMAFGQLQRRGDEFREADIAWKTKHLHEALDLTLEAAPQVRSSSGKPLSSAFDATALPDVSVQDLERLLTQSDKDLKASSLVAVEAGRQLAREILPLIFDASDFLHFKQLEAIHPFMKPIADTIGGSINDAIKKRLDAAALSIRKTILKAEARIDWNEHSKTIRAEAAEIVESRVDESVKNTATEVAGEIAKRSSRIATLAKELNFKLERPVVDKRRSSSERARAALAERLSELGHSQGTSRPPDIPRKPPRPPMRP